MMNPRFDPAGALEDLREEAVLPNPVRVRDMILRTAHSPEEALELNRKFTEYQQAFAETQRLAEELLVELEHAKQKA
jgi:hypothetical protein